MQILLLSLQKNTLYQYPFKTVEGPKEPEFLLHIQVSELILMGYMYISLTLANYLDICCHCMHLLGTNVSGSSIMQGNRGNYFTLLTLDKDEGKYIS